MVPASAHRTHGLALAARRDAERRAVRPRSFITLDDIDARALAGVVDRGLEIKRRPGHYAAALAGRAIALLFQKTSTRTRCAFAAAARETGAQAEYLDWSRSNFVLAELRDEIAVMSRYYDLIVARVDDHDALRVMAAHSDVPVVNGLCDRHHPCQAVADMLTLKEYFGADLRGLRLAYVGDGNNVCRSLVQAATCFGIEVSLSSPAGYELDEVTACQAGALLRRVADPRAAVEGADVVYTDTWVSIGQEAELDARRAALAGWQVNARLMDAAPGHALFMHCLPAHPGLEVTAEVLRSPRSIVLDQAENRKHAQKALLAWLLHADAQPAERHGPASAALTA
jgi:ornithine carbamoyltransferase